MPDSARPPRRVSLPDCMGRPFSLPADATAWERHGQGRDILILGLGPACPWDLPFVRQVQNTGARIFWLEAPQTLQALAQAGHAPRLLPAMWKQIEAKAVPDLSAHCSVYFYKPGLRLAPAFWGNILAKVQAKSLHLSDVPKQQAAILPGHEGQLLHQELRQALQKCGFVPVWENLPPVTGQGFVEGWQAMLDKARPRLLLSVNLRGLDDTGRIFQLCRALHIPVVIWFVDNPWHILSRLRLPWWQEAMLCVTDAGFLAGLQAVGAQHVVHLPLAVAPHMWRELPPEAEVAARRVATPLFVGRASFPERDRFFAAARLPRSLELAAQTVAAEAQSISDCPHVHWWHDRLGISPWPGPEIRRAGLGAENCSRARRAQWIEAALGAGFRLIGDAGWKSLLPEAKVSPPVDYYVSLPELYGRAGAVLNVTSLLLPGSLSQRHFDVWAAGGFLLSDDTPGLDIFPSDLCHPVTLARPEHLAPRLAALRADTTGTYVLCQAWQQHLRTAHCYEHRVRHICSELECSPAAGRP
ncbi:MAG: glycosyltransferase [Desulfovibrio sp.]|nr:glycosyltransferase [Desulfovibrio sp.]